MKKLTKGMVNAAKSFANYGVNKNDKGKGYCGYYYNDPENGALIVYGKYGSAMYQNIGMESEDAVKEAIGKSREMRKIRDMFDVVLNPTMYPDDYYELMDVKQLQAKVTAGKKSEEYKQCGMVIGWNFNSKYNMELLLRAVKSVCKKEAHVHFPKYANQPIILHGDDTMGTMSALILPMRYSRT